jgi:Guanylyl transferase CofC like
MSLAKAGKLRNPMSTEAAARRRVAIVLARYSASRAAPKGINPDAFAAACLADSYEVVADLMGVRSGIAGPASAGELLWPGALHLPIDIPVPTLAGQLSDEADELVVVPADVPDLPGLVIAKLFKVLHRTDFAIAPERAGGGCAAIGVSLPLADWIPDDAFDLDQNPFTRLSAIAPRRSRCTLTPTWHRLRTPADVTRLDADLEGWEETRALLLANQSLAGD